MLDFFKNAQIIKLTKETPDLLRRRSHLLNDVGCPYPDFDLRKVGQMHMSEKVFQEGNYFYRVAGSSMTGAGINNGDILICNACEEYFDNEIVIVDIDGSLYCKRYCVNEGNTIFKSENPKYYNIVISGFMKYRIISAVIGTIRFFDR